MEFLNNRLANCTLKKDQARSPAFQSWDDVLETIHRTSVYRMLSHDLKVEFSIILYHMHRSQPSPIGFEVQAPAKMVSTAGNVARTIKLFRKDVLNTIDFDIMDAPFYLVCKEEVESYVSVVAKHETKLVGALFQRNFRMGDAKFFKMAAEMKCFEGRRAGGSCSTSEEQSDGRVR